MNDETIRFFLALPLPEAVRSVLSDWCSSKKAELPFQTWVHEEDYHITLKFLGDTPSSRVGEIADSVTSFLKSSIPFSLAAEGLGIFGPNQSPNILWAGLRGELEALRTIQCQAEAAMSAIGFAKEDKPYRPHITLARGYGGSAPFQKEWILNSSLPQQAKADWQVDQVILYRSHLKQKPMYEIAESFHIGEDKTT